MIAMSRKLVMGPRNVWYGPGVGWGWGGCSMVYWFIKPMQQLNAVMSILYQYKYTYRSIHIIIYLQGLYIYIYIYVSNPFIQLNINIYILCISSTSPQAIPTPSLPGSHFVDRAKALRIRFARCILPHVQRKENGDFRNGGRFPRIFPL